MNYDYCAELHLHRYRNFLLVLGNHSPGWRSLGIIQATYSFGCRYPREYAYPRWTTPSEDTQRMALTHPWHYHLSNLEYSAGVCIGILFQHGRER